MPFCPARRSGPAPRHPDFPDPVGQRRRAYREQFLHHWRETVESILACGRTLAAAKEELPHGEWLAFVDQDLPIGRHTAARLMSIASDPRLSAGAQGLLLPPHWRTLYELSKLDDEAFKALVAKGAIRPDMTRAELKQAVARLGHAALPAPPALETLPVGRYRTILADPPWAFETWSDGGKGRGPEGHYPTLSIEEIAALPVAELAAEDCVLFLWAQWATMPDARGVIEAWGFRYATTAFVWVKEGNHGMGYWTLHGSEPCLLATKGSPKRLNTDVKQVIHAPGGRHSAKPTETRQRIERLVAGPYLELFHRGPAPRGWDAWGNESRR